VPGHGALPALPGGAWQPVLYRDRPLGGRDIAVLVPTNDDGLRVRSALARLGVRSAFAGSDDVYRTREAIELTRLLRALNDPRRAEIARASLAGPLFLGLHAAGGRVCPDVTDWDSRLGELFRWRALWEESGIGAVIRGLLYEGRAAPRLLCDRFGERRVTNYLHLAELLQDHEATAGSSVQQTLEHLESLVRRPRQAGDAAPRLEADEEAVRIVTVHGAKGLQYPIVFCPFVWDARARGGGTGIEQNGVLYHDRERGGQAVLELGPGIHGAALEAAEREQMSERARHLYVALTRAEERCHLLWVDARGLAESALARLLGEGEGSPVDWQDSERVWERLAAETARAIRYDRCSSFARAFAPTSVIFPPSTRLSPRGAPAERELSEEEEGGEATAPVSAHRRREASSGSLAKPPSFGRRLERPWRVSSYSSLAALLDDPGLRLAGGEDIEALPDRDASYSGAASATPRAPPVAGSAPAARISGEGLSLGTGDGHDDPLPPGAGTGTCLHAILERLELTDPIPAQEPLVREAVIEHGLEERVVPHVCGLLERVVRTPLPSHWSPVSLDQVPPSHRVAELAFHVAAPGKRRPGRESNQPGSVYEGTRGRSGNLFETVASVVHRHGYPGGEALRGAPGGFVLCGFLKGYIDLLYEHGGHYFIVDYKSHLLAGGPQSYSPERLRDLVFDRHYTWQYLIYTLAIHRYLARRLAGYDYERHFGGVQYLFLRGMTGSGGGDGVFFERPAFGVIHDLDAALGGRA